jgi:TonB family protein
MPSTSYAGRARFGLLPEPETNTASLVTSFLVNGSILALAVIIGSFAHHQIEQRKMENTQLIFPVTPPPEIKVKIPPPPKMPPPPEVKVTKLDLPKITLPKVEPKPEVKPLPLVKESVDLPKINAAKPQVVAAPQPKAALTAAAPAPTPQAHPSMQQVHLGEMSGVTPNPNATRPATISALGSPSGGMQGPAAMPHGVVNSTGIGNGLKSGSNAGNAGKVAAAGVVGGNGFATTGGHGTQGKVGSAGIQTASNTGSAPPAGVVQEAKITAPVLLSHGEPEYTSEGRQLKIQGEVILRVTITATGQMQVLSVIHGLGHGLDESAMRSAPTYRFQPATRNGQPVEYTTNIRIKFQTA